MLQNQHENGDSGHYVQMNMVASYDSLYQSVLSPEEVATHESNSIGRIVPNCSQPNFITPNTSTFDHNHTHQVAIPQYDSQNLHLDTNVAPNFSAFTPYYDSGMVPYENYNFLLDGNAIDQTPFDPTLSSNLDVNTAPTPLSAINPMLNTSMSADIPLISLNINEIDPDPPLARRGSEYLVHNYHTTPVMSSFHHPNGHFDDVSYQELLNKHSEY